MSTIKERPHELDAKLMEALIKKGKENARELSKLTRQQFQMGADVAQMMLRKRKVKP